MVSSVKIVIRIGPTTGAVDDLVCAAVHRHSGDVASKVEGVLGQVVCPVLRVRGRVRVRVRGSWSGHPSSP